MWQLLLMFLCTESTLFIMTSDLLKLETNYSYMVSLMLIGPLTHYTEKVSLVIVLSQAKVQA